MFESSYRLVLKKNGSNFYVRPAIMTLSTCLPLITPICEMIFLKAENELDKDDEVVCSLRSPEGKLHTIFTGPVLMVVPLSEGRIGLVMQQDISGVDINVSFVNESAQGVLLEILSQGGIENYSIEVADVEISRFTFRGTLKEALFSFLDLMNKYGTYSAFFDQDNCFCFLPESSFPSSPVEYKTGSNILQQSRDRLTSFALPVLAGRSVSVDGVARIITRSLISLSSRQSRTMCYWSAS